MLKPNQLMTVACGTPGYVAPEILCGTAYGKEVDIWSIGVILYILLCGFPPFYDDNNKKLFSLIISATYTFPDPYWTDISQAGKDLVRNLLVVDPKKRLTAAQILAHPWMVNEASNTHLSHFTTNLKTYNARRRFRGAIRAVQLTSLIKNKKFNGSLVDAIEEPIDGNASIAESIASQITIPLAPKAAAPAAAAAVVVEPAPAAPLVAEPAPSVPATAVV